MERKNIFMLLVGAIILGSIFLFFLANQKEKAEIIQGEEAFEEVFLDDLEKPMEDVKEAENQPDEMVIVDVKGQVEKPGVYKLEKGLRVVDAIHEAGGMTEKANQLQVNLAERVQDEMIIYVPKEGEEGNKPAQATTVGEEGENKLIRINYDGISELETLPGIGPSKAESILSYREENGLFREKQDLTKVSGIGEKSYEKLQDLITID